jgi:hypothetical protein
MHRTGPNPEEHQLLGMLGTLSRQILRVSWHSSSRPYDDLLIPFSGDLGNPYWRHKPAPRVWYLETGPRLLGLQDRTRYVMSSSPPCIQHPYVIHPCSEFLLDLTWDTELEYCSIVCLWVRARYGWGRKLLADGTAAPHIPVVGLPYRPLPPHLGGERPPCDPFGPHGKYPLAHYYPTPEVTHQWMEWRDLERDRLGIPRRPKAAPWIWP